MNKTELLKLVREDGSTIRRLGLGLSDVIDEREISFQLPADPTADEFSGRPSGRPFHHVFLRRERRLSADFKKRHPESDAYRRATDADWEPTWYRIMNGWAAGYLSDEQALCAYVQSGNQLSMELV